LGSGNAALLHQQMRNDLPQRQQGKQFKPIGRMCAQVSEAFGGIVASPQTVSENEKIARNAH
jgi:hypothetical protein